MCLNIAIIGQPNVGKSTLFNRLVGRKIALVGDSPGLTRDRHLRPAQLYDLRFNLIDTAGLEEGEEDSLQARMRQQTQKAVEEADIVLFVVDGRSGITPIDHSFVQLLHKFGKPLIAVVNKAEGRAAEDTGFEAFGLGCEQVCAISAEHGLGMADLYEVIKECLTQHKGLKEIGRRAFLPSRPRKHKLKTVEAEQQKAQENGAGEENKPLSIAVVGRPNVGKSTFLNNLLGEERFLAGPEAGLTRDSLSVAYTWQGQSVLLFDTAGMRRKAKVAEGIEKVAVYETLRAIRFAEIVVVMLDAQRPFEKQDLHIIDLVNREGRGLVLALNKWDLIEDKQNYLKEMHQKASELLPQIRGVRVVPLSGEQGQGFSRLLENIHYVYDVWNRRIATAELNRWLETASLEHAPPIIAGRRLRIKYMTQIKARPPSFMLSCSRPLLVPQDYLRYLTNSLRNNFSLFGVPIRFFIRGAKNPFV